jgi:beta-aspartyl-peptidase (threonine type)
VLNNQIVSRHNKRGRFTVLLKLSQLLTPNFTVLSDQYKTVPTPQANTTIITMCTIVIHGGAGVIDKSVNKEPYIAALSHIISAAADFATSSSEGSVITALDVVEYAVKLLEDEPLFNAGVGAVLTSAGTHELEASIMDGTTLKCGAASLVQTVKNPVSVARAVMELTKHNYLVGDEAAARIADARGLARVRNEEFCTERRKYQLEVAKQRASVALDHSLPMSDPSNCSRLTPGSPNSPTDTATTVDTDDALSSIASPLSLDAQRVEPGGTGTVGCVCMLNGQVAAATSTGGLTNKMPGRVGDTPITGAGNFAHHLSGTLVFDDNSMIVWSVTSCLMSM